MSGMNPNGVEPKLVICPLLNETICKPIRYEVDNFFYCIRYYSNLEEFSIVIFNSHGRYYNGTIRIPYGQKSATVRDANKNVIESQVDQQTMIVVDI